MRTRSTKFLQFSKSETQTIEVPEGTKYSVYAKRKSGSGTATFAVGGSFRGAPTSDDIVAVQSAASVSSDAITLVTDSKSSVFTYLHITSVVTGTATFEVYVSGF